MVRFKSICFFFLVMTNPFLYAQCPENKYGEPFPEDLLNGKWTWPTYKNEVIATIDTLGLDFSRLGKMPAYGIHPRLFFSKEQIPDIKYRIEHTHTGKALYNNLKWRLSYFQDTANWENKAYQLLAKGDYRKAKALLDQQLKPNCPVGHYQKPFIHEIMLQGFDALIFNKSSLGRETANAFYNYAKIIKPLLTDIQKQDVYYNNVWRAGGVNQQGGSITLMGYNFIAYAYDFLYNYMTEKQRNFVRSLIAQYSYGATTMGMNLPPHFRNWNWVAVGNSLALNVLAIEGEKGYDSRVDKLSAEVLSDYLSYGIDQMGSSTEAIGYTQFGLKWATPTMVAYSRKGNYLLAHSHYKAMKNWYLYSMVPYGNRFISHGDGGDYGPSLEQMLVLKYYYPKDSIIDYLYQNKLKETDEVLTEKQDLITSLICCVDPSNTDYKYGKILHKPNTFYDKERGSLICLSDWNKNALSLQFEGRIDGTGGSHQHADKGSFVFSALVQTWASEHFRLVESKYHNTILINGKGQGYWGPNVKWIFYKDSPISTFAAIDVSEAYNYFWPKPILANWSVDDPRLETWRYKAYKSQIAQFKEDYKNIEQIKDTGTYVKQFFDGFEKGSPKLWDEDSSPIKVPYNPVKKAIRIAGMVRGHNPYVLIVDKIQKDEKENLYEWIMMPDWNLSIVKIENDDIILGTEHNDLKTNVRFRNTARKLQKGEPLLLLRILNRNMPNNKLDYESVPPIRMETIEMVDTYSHNRGRTYGVDKRLVVPSISKSPDFIMMLYPFRYGEKLPNTTYNKENNTLRVTWSNQEDIINISEKGDNITVTRQR